MPRRRSVYRCTECGGEHANWAGRCEGCGAWNTLVEEAVGPWHTGLAEAERLGFRTAFIPARQKPNASLTLIPVTHVADLARRLAA